MYASDDNYAWLMGISMISLFENNKASKEVNVFLFGDNLFMVGLATPASSVVQIILCMIVYVRLQNKLKKTQPA